MKTNESGKPVAAGVSVESAVTKPNIEPIVVLTIEGKRATLSVAEARKIAADIVQQAARAEADAMIYQFFGANSFPLGAAQALMLNFRLFRHALDAQVVENQVLTPSFDPKPQ